VGAELVDCSFDGVAVAVVDLVEGGRSSTVGPFAEAGGVLVVLDRNDRLDLAPGQVCSDRSRGVGLVGQYGVGTCPWPSGPDPGDRDLGEGEFEGDRVVALTEGGDEPKGRQRLSAAR